MTNMDSKQDVLKNPLNQVLDLEREEENKLEKAIEARDIEINDLKKELETIYTEKVENKRKEAKKELLEYKETEVQSYKEQLIKIRENLKMIEENSSSKKDIVINKTIEKILN